MSAHLARVILVGCRMAEPVARGPLRPRAYSWSWRVISKQTPESL